MDTYTTENYSFHYSVNRMFSIGYTKRLLASVCMLLLFAGFTVVKQPDTSELMGTWKIDLRPTPDAPPYIQSLVITSTESNRLKGTFYGSTIQNGRVNTDWGRVVFAFVTQDESGFYHTTGELRDGKLSGSTHAIGRDFLALWTGEK